LTFKAWERNLDLYSYKYVVCLCEEVGECKKRKMLDTSSLREFVIYIISVSEVHNCKFTFLKEKIILSHMLHCSQQFSLFQANPACPLASFELS